MSIVAFFRDDDGNTHPIKLDAGTVVQMSEMKNMAMTTFDRSAFDKMTVSQLHTLLNSLGLQIAKSAKKGNILWRKNGV